MLRSLAPLLILAALPAGADPTRDQIIDMALEELVVLQELSLQSGREYCNIIALDAYGELIASKPRRGREATCKPRDPRGTVEVVASLHTHGTHDEYYDSEMPSTDDMLGDMDEGILGFIATPGGRIWMLDGLDGTGELLCGASCTLSDPNYDPDDHDPIPDFVTLDSLYEREEG